MRPRGGDSTPSVAPERAGAVLGTLVLVSAVANLPLAVANVALPDIGFHFNASQTELNLVAVSYSLGLACSVLWLGALGDRHGRKRPGRSRCGPPAGAESRRSARCWRGCSSRATGGVPSS